MEKKFGLAVTVNEIPATGNLTLPDILNPLRILHKTVRLLHQRQGILFVYRNSLRLLQRHDTDFISSKKRRKI